MFLKDWVIRRRTEKLSTSPVQMEKGLYVHTYRPYLWQRGREQGSLHPLILYL